MFRAKQLGSGALICPMFGDLRFARNIKKRVFFDLRGDWREGGAAVRPMFGDLRFTRNIEKITFLIFCGQRPQASVGAARLSQHRECLSPTPTNARDRSPACLNVSRETIGGRGADSGRCREGAPPTPAFFKS